jgi:L-galactose dehydrogenase
VIYRTLGKTGLPVSILSYGASPLGSVFRAIDEAAGIRTVRTAVDGGVNLIDCSPYYGLTRAETVLGRALREIPRDHYYLATKAGRYGDAEFDFSPARLTFSVEESLRRLGVDHIDILQLHDIEFGDLDRIIEHSLPVLARLKEQGKISWYGVTGLPLKIFRDVLARHPVDTILSYCRYTLNDTSLGTLLPSLAESRVGVINASATGMGLFNSAGPPDWHPAPVPIRRAAADVVALCRERDVSATDLALQFALANPGIHTTLVGTASPANMAANLRCVGTAPDAELLAEARRRLAPVMNHTWPSGRPENN